MLHLYNEDPDKPKISLDELLEGFWGGKDPAMNTNPALLPYQKVWVLRQVDHTERGPDAVSIQLFASKERALWSLWLDAIDTASYFDADEDCTDWFAEIMSKLQDLRDEGGHFDGDFSFDLQETSVD